jgi:hypothetical protein
MRTLALLLCLLAGPLRAADAVVDPMAPPPLPQEDNRAIRELQDKAFGTPSLPSEAPRQEALLALADLGGASSQAAALSPEDKAALFALLQRYRDELLALGMDSAELQNQVKALDAREGELEQRLKDLYPKDGLKMSGRFYTGYDDLHLLGNDSLNFLNVASPGTVPIQTLPPTPKPSGVGIRTQQGFVHAEIKLNGTRGPVSGMVQFDLVAPLGVDSTDFGLRRIYLEYRAPITVQIGDFDASLTPLTLWRNDPTPWFEPEPLSERREDLRSDLLLTPDKWHLRGARVTTELTLFGALNMDLESITAVVGLPGSPIYITPYRDIASGATALGERYDTYLQAWSLGLNLGSARLSYNGTLFWDNTDTPQATAQTFGGTLPYNYTSMQELVQTARGTGHWGPVSLSAEAGFSSYTNPQAATPSTSAFYVVPTAITGTALIASATLHLQKGTLKVFGRSVSPGYHAAAAQGRSVDYSYQFTGPFLTEQPMIGPYGTVSLDPNIRLSFASRMNDQLIPPGVYITNLPGAPVNGVASGRVGVWSNLLNYGPGEEIDSYGEATPNRSGFGTELKWPLFNEGLTPMASYEAFSQQNGTTVTATGDTTAPYVMTRIRAGLNLNLGAWWTHVPLTLGVGYTSTDSNNGQTDSSGRAYDLATNTLDGSMVIWAGRPMGISLGYRQMQATGQAVIDPYVGSFAFPTAAGTTWNIYAVGAWWRPMPAAVLNLSYSTSTSSSPGLESTNLEVDETTIRLTTEF